MVELVPSVPHMFGWYYPDADAVLADPEGHLVVADGRNHLELATERFDIVVTDPPPPIESSGASVISSLEYYQSGHRHLTPDGVMMQWVPFGAREAEIKEHIRTFAAEFPEVLIVRGAGGYGFYMLGSDAPIELDPEVARSILARPGVLEDISSAYDSPASDVDAWLDVIERQTWLAGDAVETYAGGGPLITDDRPRPEYFLLRRWLGIGDQERRRLRSQPHPRPDAILAPMTAPTLDAEPACPGPLPGLPISTDRPTPALHAERRAFDSIPRETWDRLASQNPWSTPFSAWAFHRAWWDAYSDNAHDETLVVCRNDGTDGDPVAIVPLMHRHEVEPSDAATRTTMRHGRWRRSDGRATECQGDPVRGVLPRGLRDDPRGSRGTCRRSPAPSPTTRRVPAAGSGTSSTSAGCVVGTRAAASSRALWAIAT